MSIFMLLFVNSFISCCRITFVSLQCPATFADLCCSDLEIVNVFAEYWDTTSLGV